MCLTRRRSTIRIMKKALTQGEMQNKVLLSTIKRKPCDCANFNSIAETMYKGDTSLFTTYFEKLGVIHKPHCKSTVPHTKFIPQ